MPKHGANKRFAQAARWLLLLLDSSGDAAQGDSVAFPLVRRVGLTEPQADPLTGWAIQSSSISSCEGGVEHSGAARLSWSLVQTLGVGIGPIVNLHGHCLTYC